MAWKFVPSDNFDLEYLEGLHKWFMKDLRAANDWRNTLNSYPDKLAGKKDMIKLADEDLKISRDNLEKVIEAIRIARVKSLEKSKPTTESKKPSK